MTSSRRLASRGSLVVAVLACGGCLQMQRDLPPTPVAAVSGARSGGTITVGIATPVSIDPALVPTSDTAGTLVVRTMCDSLLATSPVSGNLVPDLATSVQVGGSGTVVTIRLRRGLRFDDGSRLTSADVVAALNRVARPEVASPVAPMLRRVLGYEQLQQDSDQAHGRLAGVTAIDPRTVQVALTAADTGWLRTLATTVAVPVPRRYARDTGFGAFSTRPTCVGPYRLASPWRPGDPVITLVRSTAYDGGTAAETRAGGGWADRIVFRVFADARSAYDAYLRGDVDIAPVPPMSASAARQRLGDQIAQAPDATLGYIGLPTTVAPFDDAHVRLALSMALDRAALVRDVYGGGRTPAQGLYPPVVGDDVYRPDACGSSTPATADAEGAKAMLGPRLAALQRVAVALYFDDEFANRALVTAVAAQWHRALGLTVRLVPMAFPDYLQKALQAPGFDGPFRLSYAGPSGGPSDYVRDLVTAASVDTSNATRFVDRDIEQLFAHQASEHSGGAGDTAWQAIETRFCTQLPLIPLTFNDQVWAWRPVVAAANGSRVDRATGLPALREAFRRAG